MISDLFDEYAELPDHLVGLCDKARCFHQPSGKDIRLRLAENRLKVGDLAKILGVSTPLVSRVIHGQRRSPKVRSAIARIIGCPVRDIWPDTE